MKRVNKTMMLAAMLITAILLSAFLISCESMTQQNPLDYQRYPLYAKGSLCANNSEYIFELTMNEKNNAELKFSAPDTLRGYIFKVVGDKTTLSYGDMTIDFNGGNDKTNVVKLLPYVFSLDEANQKTVERGIEQNSVSLTKAVYTKGNDEIAVYINEDSKSPMRFECNGIVINISEFSKSDSTAPDTTQPQSTQDNGGSETSVQTQVNTPTPDCNTDTASTPTK